MYSHIPYILYILCTLLHTTERQRQKSWMCPGTGANTIKPWGLKEIMLHVPIPRYWSSALGTLGQSLTHIKHQSKVEYPSACAVCIFFSCELTQPTSSPWSSVLNLSFSIEGGSGPGSMQNIDGRGQQINSLGFNLCLGLACSVLEGSVLSTIQY